VKVLVADGLDPAALDQLRRAGSEAAEIVIAELARGT